MKNTRTLATVLSLTALTLFSGCASIVEQQLKRTQNRIADQTVERLHQQNLSHPAPAVTVEADQVSVPVVPVIELPSGLSRAEARKMTAEVLNAISNVPADGRTTRVIALNVMYGVGNQEAASELQTAVYYARLQGIQVVALGTPEGGDLIPTCTGNIRPEGCFDYLADPRAASTKCVTGATKPGLAMAAVQLYHGGEPTCSDAFVDVNPVIGYTGSVTVKPDSLSAVVGYPVIVIGFDKPLLPMTLIDADGKTTTVQVSGAAIQAVTIQALLLEAAEQEQQAPPVAPEEGRGPGRAADGE